MAILNGKYKVKNSQNSYDVVHLETSANQVKFDDGSNVKEKINEVNNNISLGVQTSKSYTDNSLNNIIDSTELDNILKENLKLEDDIEIENLHIKDAVAREKIDILASQLEHKVNSFQGIENVGKILVVGSDGNLTLKDMPNVSGDITGIVDEDNNILLSGNLADGTYVIKYQYEDGTYSSPISITIGKYEPKPEPNTGNLFDLETTKVNIRFSGSSQKESAQNGVWLTDLIPLNITTDHTIFVKNAIMFRDVGTPPSPVVSFFDADGVYLGNIQCNSSAGVNYLQYTEVISEKYTRIKLNVAKTLNGNDAWWSNVKFMRIAGVEDESGAAITKDMIKDVIITINDPIGTTAINLIPTAMAENLDGIFNSVGYKENIRWSGTNQTFVAANSGAPCVVTGLIPLGEDGDVLHIRGVDTIAYVANKHSGYYHCYDASGARLLMGSALPTSSCMSTD